MKNEWHNYFDNSKFDHFSDQVFVYVEYCWNADSYIEFKLFQDICL